MTDQEHEDREAAFVAYLTEFVERNDRAALASLRRGIGKAPGEDMGAYRFVAPWVKDDDWRKERAYHMVATFFAWHPKNVRGERYRSNLGSSLYVLKRKVEATRGSGESVDRRFMALLESPTEDLPVHLRQVIALLRTNEVAVDWAQLLRDLRHWDRDDHIVQRNWAKCFWAATETGAPEDIVKTNAEQDKE